MAIISKIEEQKNKKRFNIYVDDAFFCGLNKETAIQFGLKVGKFVEEDELQRAIHESEVKHAFEKSLDYISVRMYSKGELFEKLLKKGYNKDVIFDAIQKLEDYHYVDDEMFAKQFVFENTKYSKKILSNKLKQKGIDGEIIDRLLAEKSPDDEEFLCEKYVQKYLKTKAVCDKSSKQKLYASLARRGFDFDLIKKVCEKQLNDDCFDDDF